MQTAWADLLAQARQAIAPLTDPEIPVVTLDELGIVRDVRLDGDTVEVVITPTYNGCPAMQQIADDLRAALAARGLSARVTTQLAPAWTTEWITPAARDKLRAYGIAPPAHAADDSLVNPVNTTGTARGGAAVLRFAAPRAMQRVACPRCGSRNTTETSHFGSTACKSLWRCLDCLEPFDHFKPH